jgi:hypothetical protein
MAAVTYVCSTVPVETGPDADPDDRGGRRRRLMLIPVCAFLIGLARGLLSAAMRREGHLRRSSWAMGGWTGDLLYALLSEEWQTGRG